MPVVMKGGTSGCRQDYLAPTPDSGSSQPIQTTETKASVEAIFCCQNTGNRGMAASDPMPSGGGMASGTDLSQPDISGAGFGGSKGLDEIMRSMPE